MSDLSRREFLAASAATAAGVALGAPAIASASSAPVSKGRRGRPNIVFIMVDEMRFPMHFPNGIDSPEAFLRVHMPNLYRLWRRGVKFDNHYTAGAACSPSRASIVTGLYPHQQWCLQTRKGDNDGAAAIQAPALDPHFPTYGSVLREAGYRTPYVGKWHLSDGPSDPDDPAMATYLADFGFQGLTAPDPIGVNGEGLLLDGDIAGQAVEWLEMQDGRGAPFCLTVSFINPHDKELFWSGTEADTYNDFFRSQDETPMVSYTPVPPLDTPPAVGFPAVPPNWESAADLAAGKPLAHSFTRTFTDTVWGGASDDPDQTTFTMTSYPGGVVDAKIAIAPYRYWARSSDAYVQVMTLVDREIGRVVRAIEENRAIADDTVIVMTADHGDYSSSHGLLSNKAGTMYEEAVKVPLIVADPKRRLTGDLDSVRHQLTSSVDVMPLLVSIAHGSRDWMRGHYAAIYGNRLDMLALLRSSRARGRHAVIMASDEWVPGYFVFNGARRHILGLRTADMKVASYSNWDLLGRQDYSNAELESYDYRTRRGRLELDNGRAQSGRAQELVRRMHGWYDTQEMSAFLPMPYRHYQDVAKVKYLAYIALLDALDADGTITPPDLSGLPGAPALPDLSGVDLGNLRSVLLLG